MRCLRECCWEFKWIYGIPSKDLTGQYNRTTAANALALEHPYSPLQSYETTHGAFTVYIPYNIFTMCNVKNAYPLVGVYSLQRTLEYSFNTLLNCVNIWADDGTYSHGGLIDPGANNPVTGAYTWTTTPAITGTRLIVEYFVVHKDLQRMLAGQDAPPIAEADRYQAVLRAVMLLSQQVAAVEVKVARLMRLLPAMLFAYLILSFVLERLP